MDMSDLKSFQVVPSLATECDHGSVREQFELVRQILPGASCVSRGPGFVENRAKPPFGEPRPLQLLVKSRVWVQFGQEPTNVAVKQVGAVPVAVVGVAKTVIE